MLCRCCKDAHACLCLLFWYCDRTHGDVLASSVPSWCLPGEYAELRFQDKIYRIASADRHPQEQALIRIIGGEQAPVLCRDTLSRGCKRESFVPSRSRLPRTDLHSYAYACLHMCQKRTVSALHQTLAQCTPAARHPPAERQCSLTAPYCMQPTHLTHPLVNPGSPHSHHQCALSKGHHCRS